MTTIDFDCMVFEPLSYKKWRKRYHGSIRANVSLERIKPTESYLRLLEPGETLYGVSYIGTMDWRDGYPKEFTVGENPALIRIPVVEYDGSLVALDGIHRLSELEPSMILMDVIAIDKAQRVYIIDLLGKFWN